MPLTHPHVVPITEKLYRLQDDYIYEWEITRTDRKTGTKIETRQRIVVPEGFVYDGASVPRLLWTVTGMTPDGLIRAAALLHDFIYRHKGWLPNGSYQMFDVQTKQWKDLSAPWPRETADRLFARVMRESGVSSFKRKLAYRAARLLGWFCW